MTRAASSRYPWDCLCWSHCSGASLFATDTLAKWYAVILLIVHGIAGALWAPAGQVLLHEVVGSRQLQSAMPNGYLTITLGVLLGPAVGGALLINFARLTASSSMS